MLTREEVIQIAESARIEIDEQESVELEAKINAVVEMISVISEIDLSAVEPMFYPNEQIYTFRDQDLELISERSELLNNTVESESGMFKVPSMLKGGE